MNKIVIGLLLLVAISCTPATTKHRDMLWIGAAAAPINPPIGSYIAGDQQNRKFKSILDSLYVKAIVVRNNETTIALLTVDCIGLMYPDLVKIRERVAQLSDFPTAHIVLSSTHTHSGPDVVGLWGPDYQHTGVDSAYQVFLIYSAAEQIIAAYQKLQPASVWVSETTYGEPWVQNICNEEIDRSVISMQFKDDRGNSIASLTNFACHPTFLDAVFDEVSADYPGAFYQTLDKTWGGVNLFLQGAIGGWVQPVEGKGQLQEAKKRGNELGQVVMKTMESAHLLENPVIHFKSKKVCFPVDNESWKQLSSIGTVPRKILDSVNTEIAWFRIGEAQFITHPGETAPFYALETKKLMGAGPKFVLGLGNDALGYILKPEFYEDSTRLHAPYLTATSVGKQTAPLLMKHIEQMLSEK